MHMFRSAVSAERTSERELGWVLVCLMKRLVVFILLVGLLIIPPVLTL